MVLLFLEWVHKSYKRDHSEGDWNVLAESKHACHFAVNENP